MVKLEMAGEATMPVFVALLGQHDFVDEPATQRLPRRNPRHHCAAQSPLQLLEEGHEVPDGEDVVLHEQPQGRLTVDVPVDRMFQQGFLERDQALSQDVQRSNGLSSGTLSNFKTMVILRGVRVQRMQMGWGGERLLGIMRDLPLG
jgi:hypothetical protein